MATAYASLPEPPVLRGQRDFARARLNLGARLMTFAGSRPCTLIDLSCAGAKITAAECPRVGSMVVIEGLPLELFGTVRWLRDAEFGFEFETPLPLARVVELRHYADGERERRKQAVISHARSWVTGVY